MDIKTLSELTSPDDRSLLFGPFGLGGPLPVAAAAEHQQRQVALFEPIDAVPDNTRRAFERLRQLHVYGLFCYDLFTVAYNQSSLVLELALTERFMEFYNGEIPFVVASGRDQGTNASFHGDRYEDVFRACQRRAGLSLKPRTGAAPFRFRGFLSDLLIWARAEGLLRGQRNRRLEAMYSRVRNRAAHPRYAEMLMPVDSARSILDLAEMINRLWGADTPGGRLYPAPIDRDVAVFGWNSDGSSTVRFDAAYLDHRDLDPTWTYVVVRVVMGDDLTFYNSLLETTAYPTELLWGPGTWQEARRWLETAEPKPDRVGYLDRLFVVRETQGSTSWAMNADVAAALVEGTERAGRWQLLKADYPADAVTHARGNASTPENPCSVEGACSNCAVEVVGSGDLDELVTTLFEIGRPVSPRAPGIARVPRWAATI